MKQYEIVRKKDVSNIFNERMSSSLPAVVNLRASHDVCSLVTLPKNMENRKMHLVDKF